MVSVQRRSAHLLAILFWEAPTVDLARRCVQTDCRRDAVNDQLGCTLHECWCFCGLNTKPRGVDRQTRICFVWLPGIADVAVAVEHTHSSSVLGKSSTFV